ncbi:acetate--CoA ligase [Cucumibacter marinus]|uniref:acetate--CoA ligase n=1 Tax=Cucumibacter marinus TaxID=1121252 RepID=UPI000405D844|nr:acetate--CoA ligase [Cucumibacter marinus]
MAQTIFPVPAEWAANAHMDKPGYEAAYRRSIEDPDGFWAEQAERIDWIEPPTIVKNTSFDPVAIKWFEDGVLNVAANCIDRHLDQRADQPAIIWEPDDPEDQGRTLTYAQLHEEVSRCANALRQLGVERGDRVTIYLPMIPEIAIAMLACARIGAVHSVVFAGFSPEALAGRITDCASRIIITADEGRRGGKPIALKANVDAAAKLAGIVDTIVTVRHTGGEIDWEDGRDVWWHEAMDNAPADCPPEPMGAEDPLFILYTSGSTGKPKGMVHTSGGYLTYISLAHKLVFDYHEGDIYWCGADLGWITGHSFTLYAPLSNGATTLMFEGVPNYPDASRYWQIIDKYQVNQFFTAPTAIRALMGAGDDYVTRTSRASLKLLATAGEPINPEAWLWYYNVVGDGRCRVIDNYWQTETGGMMLTPLPGVTDLKPGAATQPFFGIQPQLVDAEGEVLEGEAEGNLVILDSWPSQARTIYGDHQRFVDTYFSAYKGKYFTSDGCKRDADGAYWITGRVDDVLNVSGHRMGTAEIESALVAHELVAEAAVVGVPHDIKGQGIYCYVTLMAGADGEADLTGELRQWVRSQIGPIATPDIMQFTADLPKTRSGKIMRRILRKIAEREYGALGDVSTLADPSVVDRLIEARKQLD